LARVTQHQEGNPDRRALKQYTCADEGMAAPKVGREAQPGTKRGSFRVIDMGRGGGRFAGKTGRSFPLRAGRGGSGGYIEITPMGFLDCGVRVTGIV